MGASAGNRTEGAPLEENALGRASRRAWRWWLLTLVPLVVLLGGHFWACWQLIGGVKGIVTPYPILRDDHPVNYYYSVITRSFLSQSGSNTGYDPNFMAGYPKSIVFPTSSTLAEMCVFLFGGEHPERAYKLYIVLAAMAAPPLFWLAAILWSRRAGPSSMGLLLYLTYFWTDWGLIYNVLGMSPFALSGPLSLLTMAMVHRYLAAANATTVTGSGVQRGFAWKSALDWLMMTLTTAFCCLTHASTPIVLAPAILGGFIVRFRKLSRGRVLALFGGAVAVIAINSFWLVPGILMLGSAGRSDVTFINPNVVERLIDLVRSPPRIHPTILVLAIIGLWNWRRTDRYGAYMLATGLAWTFFLGYLAGWFRSLDFLQPGRNTLFLYSWGAMPAGLGLWRLLQWITTSLPKGVAALIIGGMLCLAGWTFGPRIFQTLSLLIQSPGSALPTEMPAHLQTLISRLQHWTRPGQRLLFEEVNQGIIVGNQKMVDPFGYVRLSPLLPLLTGLEVIGGPYLKTHVATNFTQFGDGKFLGEPAIDVERFSNFAEWYDIQWVVCWSPGSHDFCRRHPQLVEIVETIDQSSTSILIGRLRRAGRPAVVGHAEVTATPGRIEVRNARPENGELVLRYHWAPRLRSNPPLTIQSAKAGDDPVGLIRIIDPPSEFTLYIDPWPLSH